MKKPIKLGDTVIYTAMDAMGNPLQYAAIVTKVEDSGTFSVIVFRPRHSPTHYYDVPEGKTPGSIKRVS